MLTATAPVNSQGATPQASGGVSGAGTRSTPDTAGTSTAPAAAGSSAERNKKRGFFSKLNPVRIIRKPFAKAAAPAGGPATTPAESSAQKTERQKLEKRVADDLRPHFGMANADTRKFSTPPKSAAEKLFNQQVDALRPGMINDPVSGLLQQKRTMKFIAGLSTEMGHVNAKIAGDSSIPSAVRAKLKKEVDSLIDTFDKAHALCAKEHDNGHKILRDCFDDAGKLCKRIAGIVGAGKPALNRSQALARQADSVDKLGIYFSDLSQLSLELKRFHFTQWASFDLELYGRKKVDADAEYAPGVVNMRTGSEKNNAWSIGLDIKTSLFYGGHLGPAAGWRRERSDKEINDEDGDDVRFVTTKNTVQGGVMAKLGGLIDGNGVGRHVVNMFAMGRASHTSGSYYDFKDPLASAKAATQREANRWRLICRSGNPDAFSNRMYKNLGRASNLVTKKLFGVMYVPVLGAPNVNQNKLDKGAWNSAKLMELTSRFGANLPLPYQSAAGRSIAALVRSAYAMVDTVELTPEQACSEQGVVPLNVKNCFKDISPTPSPYNRETSKSEKSLSRWAAGFEANASVTSMDIFHDKAGQLRATAQGSISVDYSINRINFRRVKAPHEHLDPAYNKNIDVTHATFRKLENDYRGKPKLHTYHAVSRQLQSRVWDWRHDAHVKAGVRLDNANAALNEIKTRYRQFMHVAGMMNAFKDKNYRKSLPDNGKQAYAEFDALIKDLFGIDKPTSPEQKRFVASLRDDPRLFMREGYDALSLSLARIGAHVFEAKQQIQQQCSPQHHGAKELWKGAQEVDTNYASARRLMDGIFLPISEEDLLRGASVVADAKSKNRIKALNAKVAVGVWTSPFQYIHGNERNPTTPGTASHPGGVLQSSMAGVGGSVNFSRREADEHPNTIRAGAYATTRFGVEASGILALFMGGGIESWYNRKQVADAIDPLVARGPGMKKFANEAGLIAQRMGLSEFAQELAVDFNTRTPKSVGRFTYESSRQYFRVSAKRTVAHNAALGIPLVVAPVTISMTGGFTQNASNVIYETMGSCPAYHLLQFAQFKKLIETCKVGSEVERDKKTGHVRTGIDLQAQELSKSLDIKKLRNMLAPETPEEYEGSTAIDAGYMLNKYFGSEESIVGFMEKFVAYSRTRREIGGKPVDFIGPRTEFHRFDDHEAFFNIIQTMRANEKFAPGSLTHSASHRAPDKDGFLQAAAKDARPTIDVAAVTAALKEMRRAFAENPNMTSEERARSFLGEDGSAGRIIFDAYLKVADGYNDINDGIKATCTYHITSLNEQERLSSLIRPRP